MKSITSASITLMNQLNREPTDEEIASFINSNKEKVYKIRKLFRNPTSLNKEIAPNGDSEVTELSSFIENENTKKPYEETKKNVVSKAIKEALTKLTDRQADVLRLRFGLYDGRYRTLKEIGKKYDLTKERIRQIERKAIRRLRAMSRRNGLKQLYKAL